MEIIVSIISSVIALLSLVISAFGIVHNRYLAVNEFLTKIENADFIETRRYIYNNSNFPIDDKKVPEVVNFFHHWGMLVEKHYLPLWVFDEAAGNGAIRLYEHSKEYIYLRRKVDKDPYYGEGFERLVIKLRRRQAKRRTGQ